MPDAHDARNLTAPATPKNLPRMSAPLPGQPPDPRKGHMPQGVVHTTTPDTYRVPSMANTPRQFNTRLLAASSNSQRKAVFSSKGVGEVSCFLGSAVYFALRSAVQAARLDAGRTAEFELGTPATVRPSSHVIC